MKKFIIIHALTKTGFGKPVGNSTFWDNISRVYIDGVWHNLSDWPTTLNPCKNINIPSFGMSVYKQRLNAFKTLIKSLMWITNKVKIYKRGIKYINVPFNIQKKPNYAKLFEIETDRHFDIDEILRNMLYNNRVYINVFNQVRSTKASRENFKTENLKGCIMTYLC